MVTMEDVAARAGVSQATVSFVLGGRADRQKISPTTRERVLRAASELDYQRNQLARAMVTGKSRIIGMMTPPDSVENTVRILTGAMEVTSERDYLLKVVHISPDGIDEATIARSLEWRLAGALIVGFDEETHLRLNEAFRMNAIPVSLIDNVPPVNWGVRVSSDDASGITLIVHHLLGLGHRRLAYFGGRPSPLSDWRVQTFRAAMKSAGLSVPPHWLRHSSWGDQAVIEADIYAFFRESEKQLPTAIVCSADTIAMSVIRIARTMGLRIPTDLSVTGYSNATLSEFADPALTTVDQSFYEMGRAAAIQVIGFAEADNPNENTGSSEILLPVRLIERASTAPPPPEL